MTGPAGRSVLLWSRERRLDVDQAGGSFAPTPASHEEDSALDGRRLAQPLLGIHRWLSAFGFEMGTGRRESPWVERFEELSSLKGLIRFVAKFRQHDFGERTGYFDEFDLVWQRTTTRAD